MEEQLFARRTVTLPPEIAAEIDERYGRGQFSAFVQRAVAKELQREGLREWLAEREAELGPPPQEAIDFARETLANRKNK